MIDCGRRSPPTDSTDERFPERHSRRRHRPGGGGALLHLAPRRRRCARHQGRAAGRRFRAPLRHGGRRPLRLFRLAEPRQGEHRPRREAARRRGAAPPHAREGRRVRAEPHSRSGRAPRLRRRRAARDESAARHLRHLRLRRRRALCRDEVLRPADPGRDRPRLDHRPPRRAGARRRLGRRCRRRHVRLHGHLGSAARARAHRARQDDQGLAVRRDGRLDDGSAALSGAHRQGAAARRARAPLGAALWPLRLRRRPDRDLRPERPRMGALLPPRARARCARRRSALQPDAGARREPAGAERDHRADLRGAAPPISPMARSTRSPISRSIRSFAASRSRPSAASLRWSPPRSAGVRRRRATSRSPRSTSTARRCGGNSPPSPLGGPTSAPSRRRRRWSGR